MKKARNTWLPALILTLSSTLSAQRIQTLNSDGQPVAYASVLSEDGTPLGITDMDGVLADIRGAKTLHISHVACKPLTIETKDIADGKIVLEDADFQLPDVTVTPRDYLYTPTYFRIFLIMKGEMVYYRTGVAESYYNVQKKKAKTHRLTNIQHTRPPFGTIFNTLGIIQLTEPLTKSVCQELELTLADAGQGKQNVMKGDTLVGYAFTNSDNGQRRITVDMAKYEAAKASAKHKKKKKKKRDSMLDDLDFKYYEVFTTDGQGNASAYDYQLHQACISMGDNMEITVMAYALGQQQMNQEEVKANQEAANYKGMSPSQLDELATAHGIPLLDAKHAEMLQALINRKAKRKAGKDEEQ